MPAIVGHELPEPRRMQRAAWAVFVLFAVVLLRPVLTPAHVEGFSASIVSLGLHIAHGDPGAYDQLFPANLEFFGLSRLGAALAVGVLTGGLGLSGDGAMRLLMWSGFVVLAISSWWLVRRWAKASALVAAASLLVMPGPSESAFFYNDNVLSSALAVLAIALLAHSRRMMVAVVAGLLFGLAVVTRTDAVLLGPAVLYVLWEQEGLQRPLFTRGLAMAAGALVPVVGLFALFHSTIFDVLHISRYAVTLWARGFDVRRHIQEAIVFVGYPGAVLLTAGLVALVRRRDARGLVLLVGVPLVFNIVCAGKLWQARQLLPLTPLLAALIACGWQALVDATRGATRQATLARAGVIGVVALTVLVLAGPIPLWSVVSSDGPHATIGRLRATRLWTRWQASVNADFDRIASFIADQTAHAAHGRPVALVTDHWNQDRYVHLLLQEAGYVSIPASRVAPACAKAAELFRRGDREVLLLRLHEPFIPAYEVLLGERLDTYGAPCFAAAGAAPPILLAPIWVIRDVTAGEPAPVWLLHTTEKDRAAWYDPTEAVPLTPARLAALRQLYAVQGRTFLSWANPVLRRGSTLPEAERMMAAQVAFPGRQTP